MIDAMLDPMNWSLTYGPYSLYSWNIAKEAHEAHDAYWRDYDVDAMYEERECYMDYSSMEVI